jgi:hypothetical protein
MMRQSPWFHWGIGGDMPSHGDPTQHGLQAISTASDVVGHPKAYQGSAPGGWRPRVVRLGRSYYYRARCCRRTVARVSACGVSTEEI